MKTKDTEILRNLAKQLIETANDEKQNEKRKLWSDFNSLKTRRVPVYILDPQGVWREVFFESDFKCEDWLFRHYESVMRLWLYRSTFGDDFIPEPWVTVRPDYKGGGPNWGTWGFSGETKRISETLAYHLPDPPIRAKEDLAKIVTGTGVIDEEKTAEKINRLTDAIGDIIPVIPDYYPPKIGGLSYALAYLLGPEQMMYQFYDNPEIVHSLSKIISDASLEICGETEKAGRFTNCDSTFGGNPQIQAMPYSHELPNPGEQQMINMKQHWIYDCAQEFEGAGPEIFDEFLIEYQKPIYEKFGLTAYGCCENLTKKIKHLKKIKNLRRVAVTPWADYEECAKQLEDKYVISWRPHPAEMVTNGFDPDLIASKIKEAKEIFDRYDCYWEINLKDFITVDHDRERLAKWVKVVRAALNQ
ncbi:MAG: hypothetical protein FWD23_11695 [Oscillospiraceae bacterium]|nr:hypothetical protein [Oscillospiraceae bacterium]